MKKLTEKQKAAAVARLKKATAQVQLIMTQARAAGKDSATQIPFVKALLKINKAAMADIERMVEYKDDDDDDTRAV